MSDARLNDWQLLGIPYNDEYARFIDSETCGRCTCAACVGSGLDPNEYFDIRFVDMSL